MSLMTIISDKCKHNFFIGETDYVNTYKKAITRFMSDYVLPAIKEISDETFGVYYDGIASGYCTNEKCSVLYGTRASFKGIVSSKYYVFSVQANRDNEKKGWGISFSHLNNSIIWDEDLKSSVRKDIMEELKEDIKRLEDEVKTLESL